MSESFIPDPNAVTTKPIEYIPNPNAAPASPAEATLVQKKDRLVAKTAAMEPPMTEAQVEEIFIQLRDRASKTQISDSYKKERELHVIAILQRTTTAMFQETLAVNEALKPLPFPTEEDERNAPPPPAPPRDYDSMMIHPTNNLSGLFTYMNYIASMARIVPGLRERYSTAPRQADVQNLEMQVNRVFQLLAEHDSSKSVQGGEVVKTINYDVKPFKLMLEELGVNEAILKNEKLLEDLLTKLIEKMGLNNEKINPTYQNEPPDRIYTTEPWQSYERNRKPKEILPTDLFEENIRPQPFWDGPFARLLLDSLRLRQYYPQLAGIAERLIQDTPLPTEADEKENPITSPPTSDVQRKLGSYPTDYTPESQIPHIEEQEV